MYLFSEKWPEVILLTLLIFIINWFSNLKHLSIIMIFKLPKLERLFSFLFLSDLYQLHVKMKRLICILLTFLLVYTQTRLHASNLG